MTGHVAAGFVKISPSAADGQRLLYNKSRDRFEVQDGFKGRAAIWFTKTFRPARVREQNIETYKAVKAAYRKVNGNAPMPLAMRNALSPVRGTAITLADVNRMGQAASGTSDLHTKFAAIGSTVPDKVTVHDNRKTHGTPVELGRGAFNVVYKHNYNVRAPEGGHIMGDRVLKPMRPPQVGEGFGWVAGKTGIDQAMPRWAERNIAATAIDRLLGTNCIARSEFGVYAGEPCLAMDKAPGGKAIDVLVGDPAIVRDPQIQRLTNHLEVVTYLIGNGDNHAENYMIHYDPPNGSKVTGIDNDQSFGKRMRDPDKAPDARTTQTHGYRHTGFPAVLDKAVYDKLMSLDFDKHVKPQLQGRISDDEMTAAKDRFDNAKSKANMLAMQGRVVSDWKRWTQEDGSGVPGGDLFGATASQDRVPQGTNRNLSHGEVNPNPKLITAPRSMLMRDRENLGLDKIEMDRKAAELNSLEAYNELKHQLGISV